MTQSFVRKRFTKICHFLTNFQSSYAVLTLLKTIFYAYNNEISKTCVLRNLPNYWPVVKRIDHEFVQKEFHHNFTEKKTIKSRFDKPALVFNSGKETEYDDGFSFQIRKYES